ncbi:MAG: CCA tRNA nucleotidyltransferase [Candidatus Margulisiibacteriota bacterium]
MFTIDNGAANIVSTLKAHGFQAYLVGGCVRDSLLGLAPDEWDIATSARPEEVKGLFDKVVPTGIEFGTMLVVLPEGQYEVTTFRSDARYADGRHPESVSFAADLNTDLSRRDFTINALAYDQAENKLVDLFDGQADLKRRLIKTVGNPLERFLEDGLRPVRACRLAAKLGFAIEPATLAAIPLALETVKKVAPERFHDELIKLLKTGQPSIGLELMRQTGLLKLLIPELDACFGVEQPAEFHNYDVYWHSLRACDAAPADNPTLRLAALLHDIGKPSCKEGMTFYNHDQVGAKLVSEILRRLRFGNSETEQVSSLIAGHMFDYRPEWSDAAVRRFIRRAGGLENIETLFELRRADAKAMKGTMGTDYLNELRRRIDKIIEEENALHVKELKVDGRDIMKVLNIPPGPKVGEILDHLLEKVLDDPSLNQKETLLELVKKYGA